MKITAEQYRKMWQEKVGSPVCGDGEAVLKAYAAQFPEGVEPTDPVFYAWIAEDSARQEMLEALVRQAAGEATTTMVIGGPRWPIYLNDLCRYLATGFIKVPEVSPQTHTFAMGEWEVQLEETGRQEVAKVGTWFLGPITGRCCLADNQSSGGFVSTLRIKDIRRKAPALYEPQVGDTLQTFNAPFNRWNAVTTPVTQANDEFVYVGLGWFRRGDLTAMQRNRHLRVWRNGIQIISPG